KGTLTIRAAAGYRPVFTGNIIVLEKNELTVEGLDVRGFLTSANDTPQTLHVANCSLDSIVAQTDANVTTEVTNSIVKTVRTMGKSDGRVLLRNSVIGFFDLNAIDGANGLTLEHCAIWHPGPDFAMTNFFHGTNQGTTAITAQATLFEAGGVPFGA